MNKLLYKFLVAIVSAPFISACNTENQTDAPLSIRDVTTIEINAPKADIAKSESVQLTANGITSGGNVIDISSEVEWRSSDTDSVTVDSKGIATGFETGSATITAYANGITSKEVTLTVLPAQLSEIQISPHYLSLIQGKQRQLSALGIYDDETTADISASVKWHSDNEAAATIDASGLLTALDDGEAVLTATVEGIVSAPTTSKICQLQDECLSVVDKQGKRFTSSPSEVLLTSLAYSQYDSTYSEEGIDGPEGEFAVFTHSNAVKWCKYLASNQYEGRSNWRLASRNELLQELYGEFGHMYLAQGWPASRVYWSNTANGSKYYNVGLYDGFTLADFPNRTVYASCVSVAA